MTSIAFSFNQIILFMYQGIPGEVGAAGEVGAPGQPVSNFLNSTFL